MATKTKKQLAQIILGCFIFVTFFSIHPKTTFAANTGRLDFSPNDGTIYVGDEFNVQVTIDSDSPADAVDAFFTYPATNLEILNITPGSAFQAYPGLQYNSPPGQVRITGFSVGNTFQGTGGVIATMRIKAKTATPDAWIKYDFTLQEPPITTDSNIAKTITSEDILKSVGEAHFQLIPDNNPPYTISWNPTPDASGIARNTNISFRIKDDERGVNINTVSININGTTYTKSSPQFSYSGTKENYHVVINPTADFNYSETVNITINGADIDGNTMSPYKYSFKIGDEPPKPNVAPKIVSITPSETTINNETTKLLEVIADDPDAPNTDLILNVDGVPTSITFTDNGDGTGFIDYTDLAPGNYFVVFTATDAGTPKLSGSDGTWIMVATPYTPPPPTPPPTLTPQNHAPKFKPVDPIETSISTEEVVIVVEATDEDNDPLTLSVDAAGMSNFTFLDHGNGSGTLHWIPEKSGLFSAVFTAEDPQGANDKIVATIFVQGEVICPILPAAPAEEPILICPPDEEAIPDSVASRLPDELTVSRAEVVESVMNGFNISSLKADKLNRCEQNIDQCLLIFKNQSSFKDIDTSLKTRQLFPDVSPSHALANTINIAALDGIVTGYYGDSNSPFKPDRVITRIEAIAIALRSIELVQNLYRDELSAILGGEEELKQQSSSCTDVNPELEAQWWYPRYLNKAVEIGLIPAGTCRPDQFLSEEELVEIIAKIKAHVQKTNYTTEFSKDSDFDGLKDLDEIKIFGTNPNNPDTDDDGLSDYEESISHKTNPLKADTDGDGISDYEELKRYETNPFSTDSDGDGFTDKFEITNKINPLDKESLPIDENNNLIDDDWEKKYNIFEAAPAKSTADKDNDRDGLSNKLEFIYDTHPLKPDTDKDGISDSEETLIFKTDPKKENKPTDVVIQITNLTDGQKIASRKPIIQGIGPSGIPIMIIARNEFGHELVLGQTIAEENNVFIFEVPIELQDGEYYFLFKVLDQKNKQIITSTPIRVIIDPEISVKAPIPTKLDDKTITNDVLLNNIRVEIINNRPTLIGKTDVGNQIIAIWKSVVFTSALIADSATGDFEVTAPKELAPGEHKVFVYALRPGDQTISETISIQFEIKPKPSETAQPRKTATPEKEPTFAERGQAFFAENADQWPIIATILGLGIIGYIAWIFIKRRKEDNEPPKPNS